MLKVEFKRVRAACVVRQPCSGWQIKRFGRFNRLA